MLKINKVLDKDKNKNNSKNKKDIYITDLGQCKPVRVLSKTTRKGCWRLIPYEAEGISGVMVNANSLTGAPDITLRLGLSGWYAIYAGFWNAHYAYDGPLTLKLKLSGDACLTRITDPEPQLTWPGSSELKEAFFKYAELTNQNLVIGQQNKGIGLSGPQKANLAYIRLVPLSGKEVSAIEKDRARQDTRKAVALNDGNGIFYYGPTTKEELLEQIEPYRHSDVGMVLFAVACGEIVNFPSRIGIRWVESTSDGVETIPAAPVIRNSLEALNKKGIVPVEVLAEHAHKMGIQFQASFRLAILGDIPPHDLWRGVKKFAHCRPDLRMVDKDGTPIEKLSYAFGEVQDFMLGLIREVAEGYDIDGVNLCFIRGPQFVGYESIVIEDFKKKYGLDPRTLDENDLRVQRHRAGYLNDFVRAARKLVDEVGASKGKKMELSAIAQTGQEAWNLFYGLDVLTWLKEKLLDSLFVAYNDQIAEPFEPAIIEAIRASRCKLIIHGAAPMSATRDDILQCVHFARLGFQYGVDGFFYWDLNSKQSQPELWEVIRQIGHREQVDKFAKKLPVLRTIPLKTIAGLDVCHTTNRGAKKRNITPPEMLPCYSGG